MVRRIATSFVRRTLDVAWSASLLVAVLVIASIHLLPLAGTEVFAVRSGSMAPAIPVGSAIVVSRMPAAAIEVGSVVTIQTDNGAVFTHRVVEVDDSESDTWLRTKGDANPAPDPGPVPSSRVVGVVQFWIPVAGYLLALLSTPTGIASWLGFLVALMLAMAAIDDDKATVGAGRRSSLAPDAGEA